MRKKFNTYHISRFLTFIGVLVIVALNSFHFSKTVHSQQSIEHAPKEKKETVLKQLSYEAVVPFFQVNFQQDFDLVQQFFWQSEPENQLIIKDNYIHLLLSYFVNLFTYTICVNAP